MLTTGQAVFVWTCLCIAICLLTHSIIDTYSRYNKIEKTHKIADIIKIKYANDEKNGHNLVLLARKRGN
jgi:hypothetical protein